jgi:hypothetical protein
VEENREIAVVSESVACRLHRWAESLPVDEDLPITEGERYELALYAAELPALTAKRPVECWLDLIENGAFRFLGHRVVILREGRYDL